MEMFYNRGFNFTAVKNSAKVYSKLDPYLAVNEAGAVDGTPQGARFARVNRGLTKRGRGSRRP